MTNEPHSPAASRVGPGTRLNGIYEVERLISVG